jgi:hypothetical protein
MTDFLHIFPCQKFQSTVYLYFYASVLNFLLEQRDTDLKDLVKLLCGVLISLRNVKDDLTDLFKDETRQIRTRLQGL